MARVIFARRHHPGSALLRTFMWSPWSHCGIVDGDTVIEAMAGHGVVRTPLAEFLARSSRWAMVEFPIFGLDAVQAAQTQLGKRYDWTGALGIALHRAWGDEDAWFCSELVAWALEQAGLKLFRDGARRITPQHLWMLSTPMIASQ